MIYFDSPHFAYEYYTLSFGCLDDKPEEIDHAGDFEWMQYTNLVDENGKDIYEGDIVTIATEMAKYNTIEWFGNGWYYSNYHAGALPLHITAPNVAHCIVIGNIYENPELLN